MRKTRILAIAAVAALTWSSAVRADLTVDTNLGVLTGDVNLTGTTVGANDNAQSYSAVNSFDYSLGERVYEFTLNDTYTLGITNNEGIFVGSDHDHILLNSLTTVAGDATGAIGFVDEDGLFSGTYGPGTYYLSIDTYGNSTEGTYDVDLTAELYVPPTAPACTDLGTVNKPGSASGSAAYVADTVQWYCFTLGEDVDGGLGETLSVNTFGNTLTGGNFGDFDSEIALFDSTGVLLANNDQAGGNESEIVYGDDTSTVASSSGLNLTAGTYYIAASHYNLSVSDGWTASASDSGTISGDMLVNVEFTPEPGTALLLTLGVVGLIRRRRHA